MGCVTGNCNQCNTHIVLLLGLGCQGCVAIGVGLSGLCCYCYGAPDDFCVTISII